MIEVATNTQSAYKTEPHKPMLSLNHRLVQTNICAARIKPIHKSVYHFSVNIEHFCLKLLNLA